MSILSQTVSHYHQYISQVIFKDEMDAGCPDHSSDQLTEILLCKLNGINTDLFIFTTLSVEHIQELKSLMLEINKRYE